VPQHQVKLIIDLIVTIFIPIDEGMTLIIGTTSCSHPTESQAGKRKQETNAEFLREGSCASCCRAQKKAKTKKVWKRGGQRGMGGVMAYLDRGDTGRKDEAHVVGVNHHHDSNHTSSTPPTVLPWNLLLSLRALAFSRFGLQESCSRFRGHKSRTSACFSLVFRFFLGMWC